MDQLGACCGIRFELKTKQNKFKLRSCLCHVSAKTFANVKFSTTKPFFHPLVIDDGTDVVVNTITTKYNN